MATFVNTLGATLGSVTATATAIEAAALAMSAHAEIWSVNARANVTAATKAAPEHAKLSQATRLATARIESLKTFKTDEHRKIYQDSLDFFKE